MRRHRVAALGIGTLASLAGCTSFNSTLDLMSSTTDAMQIVSDQLPHKAVPPAAAFEGDVQQSGTASAPIVDLHPYVRAEFTSLASGVRRLRADFRVDQDAYVLIGHIDASGDVRVVFPATPADNGFIQANRGYQSAEFVGGFTDDYRYRYQTSRYNGFQPESYDGNVGYMFIIASSQPMNYGSLMASAGGWDSFELVNPDQVSDPRAAVQELARSLASDAVVSFAHAYDTINETLADVSPYPYSTPGYADCAFAPAGFGYGIAGGTNAYLTARAFSLGLRYPAYGFTSYSSGYGYSRYGALGDCYSSPYSPYGPFIYAAFPVPFPVPVPVGPRNPPFRHFVPGTRLPGEPTPPRVNAHFAGPTNVDPGVQNAEALHFHTDSPEPSAPTTPVTTHFEQPRGPIPTPTARRPEQPQVQRPEIEQPRIDQPRAEQPHVEQPRVEQPRAPQPRVEQPHVSAPPPRIETPRSYSPPPRVEAPRSYSPPPRVEAPRSPPPSSPPQSSPPPSSSSSSGSKPPGKAH